MRAICFNSLCPNELASDSKPTRIQAPPLKLRFSTGVVEESRATNRKKKREGNGGKNTYFWTCSPTFMGGYSASRPSSRPRSRWRARTARACSARCGMGARSKSLPRCQKKVLLMRMRGRSGNAARRRATVSSVCWFTTTSWSAWGLIGGYTYRAEG